MEPIHFAGNDYLGLARDPRIAQAACRAARRYGFSTGAGRWSIGWSELHQRLEEELKSFFRTEDACIQGAAYLCGPAFFSAAAEE
jgi:8-amino-7-oxononanoate synthase